MWFDFSFISIDLSNEGIRKTDYTQWINIQEDIQNSNNKNIFIILNAKIEDFEDSKEKELLLVEDAIHLVSSVVEPAKFNEVIISFLNKISIF